MRLCRLCRSAFRPGIKEKHHAEIRRFQSGVANTKLVKTDPVPEVRKLKNESGPDIVIMGSGTIVSQLTQERLIDEYQVVVIPIILSQGRTSQDCVYYFAGFQ